MTKPRIDLPPRATVREVVDTYFGHDVVDPYRWMEDPDSRELATWLAAQNAYSRSCFDCLPERDALLRRLREVSHSGDALFQFQRRGERYFYLRLAAGEGCWRLCTRDGLAGPERTLVETESGIGAAGPTVIVAYDASHDGTLVSYLISAGGVSWGDVHFVDVATGYELRDRIEHTRWDAGTWLPDNSALAYLRFPDLAPDAPATDRLRGIRVYLHRVGQAPADDTPLFGFDVEPVAYSDRLIPHASIQPGGALAVADVNTGVSPNSAFFVAPLDALGQGVVPWRQVVRLEDDVRELAIHGDDLYLLTFQGAPRYKVLRTSVTDPRLSEAEVVFPESNEIVEQIAAAKDALYVATARAGIGRLYRLDYATGRREAVELPYDGSIYIEVADVSRPGCLLRLTSWTRPPALYKLEPSTRAAQDTGVIPTFPLDLSAIETVMTKVPSHDGTMIPLTILRERDMARDARRPTWLTGYGAYGVAYSTPRFSPWLLPWLERGGIYAVAGVRGGGEFGEAWHLAGKQATKPNTWLDFIACAEFLIDEGYTSPAHLAAESGSAGGILVGNAIAERPDLFRAAVIHVGLTNALRMETTANGVPNIPEFGSCTTEEGFRSLLAMDAYHKLLPGAAYPAVLLTHGINDPLVNPWFSAKLAARLQAVSTGHRPVLVRIDYESGHGTGTTRDQRMCRLADVMAFLFDQLSGAPG